MRIFGAVMLERVRLMARVRGESIVLFMEDRLDRILKVLLLMEMQLLDGLAGRHVE